MDEFSYVLIQVESGRFYVGLYSLSEERMLPKIVPFEGFTAMKPNEFKNYVNAPWRIPNDVATDAKECQLWTAVNSGDEGWFWNSFYDNNSNMILDNLTFTDIRQCVTLGKPDWVNQQIFQRFVI